jgi:hypothetical protein
MVNIDHTMSNKMLEGLNIKHLWNNEFLLFENLF